jgi:hypothetical protein
VPLEIVVIREQRVAFICSCCCGADMIFWENNMRIVVRMLLRGSKFVEEMMEYVT